MSGVFLGLYRLGLPPPSGEQYDDNIYVSTLGYSELHVPRVYGDFVPGRRMWASSVPYPRSFIARWTPKDGARQALLHFGHTVLEDYEEGRPPVEAARNVHGVLGVSEASFREVLARVRAHDLMRDHRMRDQRFGHWWSLQECIGFLLCEHYGIRVTFPDELIPGMDATLRIEE